MSEDASFEELQRELEDIVTRLERGDVAVDDAIALFRRGAVTIDLLLAQAKLLDAELGPVEQLGACPVERLAALPERERLVERDVAALEPRHELVELALELLERPLAQGRTSSTRAPSPPVASSTSIGLPGATTPASRTTAPPARTIA